MTSPTAVRSRYPRRLEGGRDRLSRSGRPGTRTRCLRQFDPDPVPNLGARHVPGGPTGHYDVAAGIHGVQACHRHRAGEPVLRQLLRHLPRGGRNAHAERHADGVRTDGCRWMPKAVPRHGRRQRRRPTWDSADAKLDVNGGAMDGFIKEASGTKKGCGVNVDNPAC